MRALVVDDQATSRNLLAGQLEARGVPCVCVSTAQDALQALVDATVEDQPFELALLDYHMPECDGDQLGRLIRTYDHLSHTQLVLLRPRGHSGKLQRLQALGFSGALPQPATETDIKICLDLVMRDRAAPESDSNAKGSEDASESIDLSASRVITISAYRTILRLLKQDPDLLRELSPEALESFVQERLEVMGYACTPIGSTRQADGGIDLLACPIEAAPFPYLLAIQVKSHRGGRQSPPREVRDFLGAITGRPITAGVLVTNTTFSMDAKWFAEQHKHLLRLRDVHDLRRWIHDDFAAQEPWREIPSSLELRPGLVVNVHDALTKKRG